MMKKKLLSAILSLTVISSIGINIVALVYNEETPEVGDGVYDGYDLECEKNEAHPIEKPHWWWSYCDYDIKHPELQSHGYYIDDSYDLKYDTKMQIYTHTTICWWCDTNKKDKTAKIEFKDLATPEFEQPWFSDQTVRVPDTVNGYTVTKYFGSSAFKAFDVNPENQYFKSDGQALLSKDGKKLLSFAQYNPITEYTVPQGVEKIDDSAFACSNKLRKIYVTDNVKKIGTFSFVNMDSLEAVIFDSFKIKIDRSAFGWDYNAKLLCTQKPDISSKDNRIWWDKIPKASYYEIYQKLNNGEYRLIKKTTKSSCKFTTLKSGKNYTFAVKPVAIIPAANYNKETDEYEINGKTYQSYPKTFTIEGIMSEDIVLTGK